ncbi:MAG: amidohydrolase family protein [Novosphingobium sp.]
MPVLEMDLIPNPIDRIISADRWMPPSDIRLISADDHLLEADHIFEERLPAKFQAKAPKLWRDKENGHVHVEIDGKSFDPPGIGTIGHECPGFWDAGERLKAMDAEDIEASVLYHGQAQALNYLISTDPELYFACMDVYNDWMAEYTAPHRDRLVGMAILPSFLRPETARDQMQKLKDLGFRSVQMPSYPRGVRYNSREMDPVWEAVVESGLPLSFHVTATLEFSGWGSLGANLNRNLSPFRPLLGQLIFSGVFERHPDLRVVFAEGGATWVADAIVSMDKITRSYHSILKPRLAEMPSFYWRRNCFATFMDDPLALRLVDVIGADNMMWSIDYPHPESVYGYTGEITKSIYDAVGHDDARKILGGTAARLYQL